MVRAFAHGSLDRSFMVDPLSYFSLPPVLHAWCIKGLWYVLSCLWDDAYKKTLLLIGKNNLFGGSYMSDDLLLCLTSYNRKSNVLSASLNKNSSFLPFLFRNTNKSTKVNEPLHFRQCNFVRLNLMEIACQLYDNYLSGEI